MHPSNPGKKQPILSPQAMRERDEARNMSTLKWAIEHQLGTKPATFQELSCAPTASLKGSCVRRRAS